MTTGRGFVCILDLRRGQRDDDLCPATRLIAYVAVFSLIAYGVCLHAPLPPAQPLHSDHAMNQLAAWESPTGFLLDSDPPATPRN